MKGMEKDILSTPYWFMEQNRTSKDKTVNNFSETIKGLCKFK